VSTVQVHYHLQHQQPLHFSDHGMTSIITGSTTVLKKHMLFGTFLKSDISQGSAATHLRCDEIISNGFIVNLLQVARVKKVKYRSIFDNDMTISIVD